MEQRSHPYEINPFCGIFCTLCKYSIVRLLETMIFNSIVGVIKEHERSNKLHQPRTREEDLSKIKEQLLKEVMALAVKIAALPRKAAILELRTYLHKADKYPYCVECRKLVHPDSYDANRHRNFCNEKFSGCEIKGWGEKRRVIVPNPFKRSDLSPLFLQYFEKEELKQCFVRIGNLNEESLMNELNDMGIVYEENLCKDSLIVMLLAAFIDANHSHPDDFIPEYLKHDNAAIDDATDINATFESATDGNAAFDDVSDGNVAVAFDVANDCASDNLTPEDLKQDMDASGLNVNNRCHLEGFDDLLDSTTPMPEWASEETLSEVRKKQSSGKPYHVFDEDKRDRTLCLEDFEFGKELNEGGFSVVYLARDIVSGYIVALKVLLKKTDERDDELFRIQRSEKEDIDREIDIHKHLCVPSKPNILSLYSYFENETQVFLILDYCAGGSLYDALYHGNDAEFGLHHAASIAFQVAEALSYCHSKKVIYRDLKPENVLIGSNGEFILADFGLAIFKTVSIPHSYPVEGTRSFMSPEMLNNDAYDERTDIWSFGVLMYEILARKALFDEDSANAFARNEHEIDISESVMDVDAKDLISKLLVRNFRGRIALDEVKKHKWITKT